MSYTIQVVEGDEELVQTAYNLLIRKTNAEKLNIKEQFKSLCENLSQSVSRVSQTPQSDQQIEFRLDAKEDSLQFLYTDYKFSEDRLTKRRGSGRLTRKNTQPSLTLIPYQHLIETKDVIKTIQRCRTDSELQFWTTDINLEPQEFVTTQGDGISAATLNSWVEQIKQQSHKLKSEQDRITRLGEQLLEQKPETKQENKKNENELNTYIEKLRETETQSQDLNQQILKLTKENSELKDQNTMFQT